MFRGSGECDRFSAGMKMESLPVGGNKFNFLQKLELRLTVAVLVVEILGDMFLGNGGTIKQFGGLAFSFQLVMLNRYIMNQIEVSYWIEE